MTQDTKISLVTPTLNSAKYLTQTFESIALQNGPFNCQHVVIDGGSTDRTLEIIKTYEDRIDYWESGADGGMYDALCNGFERTDGEVMGWLNGDDIYFPWTLSTVASIFSSLPEVEWLSTLSPVAIDEEGHIFKVRHIAGLSSKAFIDGVYVGFDGFGNPYASDFIQQESTFWRRSLWDRLGPDPLARYRENRRPSGDFALWAQFAGEARLYGIETPLAGWRRHAEQWTEEKSYMAEVQHALRLLRLDKSWNAPKFNKGEPIEYIGSYIEGNWAGWRTVERKFFVMPQSDIKTAIATGQVF